MRVHDNSLKTYDEIIEHLPKRRSQVYKKIYDLKEATLEQICNHLGLLPHKVSGRLTELKEANLIEHFKDVQSSDDRQVSVYRITKPNNNLVQPEMFDLQPSNSFFN